MTTKKAAPVAARRRKNKKIARATRARERFRMSRDVFLAFVIQCQFNTAITEDSGGLRLGGQAAKASVS